MKHRKIILIVDDGEINRTLLRRILGDTYELLEAENGAKALRLLEDSPRVDAVVLDLLMPVMDGFALLSAVRGNSRFAALPMLVTTQANGSESELRALECGATDFVAKPYKPAVVKQRLANLLLISEAAALRSSMEVDPLTGLYNKRSFLAKADLWFAEHAGTPTQLICFDIERFKIVNDLYGTAVGDQLLYYVAQKTRQITGRTGLCGRLDADEFAICLPVARDNAQRVVTRMCKAMENYPLEMDIFLAFGVYRAEGTRVSARTMCDRAAMASRSIKGSYVTRWAFYDETMRSKLLREQEIVNDTRAALAQQQFEVWLQPKYDLNDSRVVGAEALVRWRHPEKGLIPPGEFIPIFEHNGFILQLDEYVWEHTCAILRDWHNQGRTLIPVSVNISRMDFYSSNLCATLTELVKKYELPQGILELELTESAYCENPHQLIEATRELRRHGFRILMDDFGSGYSSLNMLKDVPIDEIKIDLGFLKNAGESGRGGVILSSVARMASWLHIPLIAEGVETVSQMEFLRSIGCCHGQGYYYSRPLCRADFEQMLDEGAAKPAQSVTRYSGVDMLALLNSDSSYNVIFNSIDEPVGLVERTGGQMHLLRMNDAYYRISGITRQQFANQAPNEFYNSFLPEDRKWLEQAFQRAKPNEFQEGSVIQLTPDGVRVRLGVRIRLLSDDGSGRQLFLITAWDNKLDPKSELRRVLEYVPDGLGVYQVTDKTITIRYVSRGMARLNEQTEENYVTNSGKNLADILGKEQAEQLRQACMYAYDHGVELSSRYCFLTQKGAKRWGWMRGHVLKEQDGTLSCYALISDVTEQHLLEEQLAAEKVRLEEACRASRMDQERYAMALLLANRDLWEYEFSTGRALMKTDLLDRYGIRERVVEHFTQRLEKEGIIEPEFVESHRDLYRRLEAGATATEWTGKTCLASGEKRWVQVRTRTIFDDKHRPERAINVLEDITQRRDEEERYELAQRQKQSLSIGVMASIVLDATTGETVRAESYLPQLPLNDTLKNAGDIQRMIRENVPDAAQRDRLERFVDLKTLEKRWQAGSRSGEAEYQRMQDGKRRWVRMSVRLERDEATGHLVACGVLRDIDSIKNQQLALEAQARNDSLTGVLNRGTLEQRINDRLSRAGEGHGAFIIFDLDDFKQENDTLGHRHGDRLLTALAEVLKRNFRRGDVVGRLGGDEFVVFLPSAGTAETAEQKMKTLYDQLWLDGEDQKRISVSAGVSLAPADGADFDTLYANADRALYTAKRGGKGCWRLFDRLSMEEKALPLTNWNEIRP